MYTWDEHVYVSPTVGLIAIAGSSCKSPNTLTYIVLIMHPYKLIMSNFTPSSPGKELVQYETPQPISGIHRLVFILFQQRGRETVFAPEVRHNFITRNFARQYNLGSPVAAVYFNCQREAGSGGRRFRAG